MNMVQTSCLNLQDFCRVRTVFCLCTGDPGFSGPQGPKGQKGDKGQALFLV